jgi:hypothetical protein
MSAHQCQGQTLAGHQCKKPAKVGSNYCGQHQSKSSQIPKNTVNLATPKLSTLTEHIIQTVGTKFSFIHLVRTLWEQSGGLMLVDGTDCDLNANEDHILDQLQYLLRKDDSIDIQFLNDGKIVRLVWLLNEMEDEYIIMVCGVTKKIKNFLERFQ